MCHMPSDAVSPRLDAVLFDVDGAIADTGQAHAGAWKRLFDEYLSSRAAREHGEPTPFDADSDYRRSIAGWPPCDGLRRFLASRGIELPEGTPDDAANRETVWGLTNRQDGFFRDWIDEHGVQAFPGTMALVDALHRDAVGVGVFSTSRFAECVLRRAGVLERFDVRFDATDLALERPTGNRHAALLLGLAARLGAAPRHAAIVEDTAALVQAGKQAGFAFAVGIDRGGHGDVIASSGADLVVADAGEIALDAARLAPRMVDNLPSLEHSWSEIEARIRAARPVVFLDYDGTLTDIVENPDEALLPDETRGVLAALAERIPVAVVSGRDLTKLRQFVGLDTIYYAASHGFEIAGPNGYYRVARGADAYAQALDDAESALARALGDIRGHSIERKAFAIAVHYRRVAEADVARIEQAIDTTLAAFPRLRKNGGKKVFEIVPTMRWHKGEAVSSLVERMEPDSGKALPIYVGDDLTDEDALRALCGRGIGVVVRDGARRTSARYSVDGPDEVCTFLARLAALTDAAGA